MAGHKTAGEGASGGTLAAADSREGLREEEMLQAAAELGIQAEIIAPLPAARHIFTHVEWDLCGFMARTDTAPDLPDGAAWMDDPEAYSIPSAFAAYRDRMI